MHVNDDDDDNGYVDVLIIFSCVLQRHHYGISSGSVSVLYNGVIRIVVAFYSRKQVDSGQVGQGGRFGPAPSQRHDNGDDDDDYCVRRGNNGNDDDGDEGGHNDENVR